MVKGGNSRQILLVFKFCFEILTDLHGIAKLRQRGSVYPLPSLLRCFYFTQLSPDSPLTVTSAALPSTIPSPWQPLTCSPHLQFLDR